MADEPRQQPVAIRVTRPFSSPDDFLEHELETLTRTSVTLIGAQSRPKGVILRFEVALVGGAQLLRGEGRVVGYKENALGDQPGLVLRFTRLDTKSKALVDKAAAIREGRARAALQAAMGEDSSAPPPMPPPSFPPHSIGPMSIAQSPSSSSRDTIPLDLPSSRQELETPSYLRTSSSENPVPQSSEAPPAPAEASSFDDAMFAAPSEPRTSSRPELPRTAPPSSPTVADDSLLAARAGQARHEDHADAQARADARAASFNAPYAMPMPTPPMPDAVLTRPEPTPPPVVAAFATPATGESPRFSSTQASPASATDRGSALDRLRERAKGLSADRLNALVRR